MFWDDQKTILYTCRDHDGKLVNSFVYVPFFTLLWGIFICGWKLHSDISISRLLAQNRTSDKYPPFVYVSSNVRSTTRLRVMFMKVTFEVCIRCQQLIWLDYYDWELHELIISALFYRIRKVIRNIKVQMGFL